MSQRIRYGNRSDDGTRMSSLRNFELGDKSLSIHIELNKMQYYISDDNNGGVVTEGSANSLNSLKKAAKNALIELGVQFSSETRDREA